MSYSEEEVMTSLKASVLHESRPLLCKTLDPKLHYPYLRSKYVLSEDDEELIEIEQLRKRKVHKMIDILMKKGRKGFDELVISIIQEKTQLFLAESLNKAFEEKRKRLFALTAENNDDLSTVGAVEHVPFNENKKDLSINGIGLGSLPKFSALHSDKNNKNSSLSQDTLRNSLSDFDSDELPKPSMSKPIKSNDIEDDLKIYRKKSCENSFDEDLDDGKSSLDSMLSENESKA